MADEPGAREIHLAELDRMQRALMDVLLAGEPTVGFASKAAGTFLASLATAIARSGSGSRTPADVVDWIARYAREVLAAQPTARKVAQA